MSSPTVRSKKLLEDEGWTVAIAERWIPGANIRKDLFGILDLVCIHNETGETMGVQTTSGSNVSARIHKILDCPDLPTLRKCNWRLEVHGWRKSKNRWICRREDIS